MERGRVDAVRVCGYSAWVRLSVVHYATTNQPQPLMEMQCCAETDNGAIAPVVKKGQEVALSVLGAGSHPDRKVSLVATRSAFPRPWSAMDRATGYKRRYTKTQLGREARWAGLRPLEMACFFATLAMAALAIRLLGHGRRKAGSDAEILAPGARLPNPGLTVDRPLRLTLCAEGAIGRVATARRPLASGSLHAPVGREALTRRISLTAANDHVGFQA